MKKKSRKNTAEKIYTRKTEFTFLKSAERDKSSSAFSKVINFRLHDRVKLWQIARCAMAKRSRSAQDVSWCFIARKIAKYPIGKTATRATANRLRWGKLRKWESREKNSAFQVKRSEKLGRYMVASRDLKAGEVLFREFAVVHGPKMLSQPICLGCHKSLSLRTSKATFYRCTSCAWPLCSKSCETLDPHLDECKLMSSKDYKCPIKANCVTMQSDAIYCLIFPLRMLLLKRRQPKMWEIWNFVTHFMTNIVALSCVRANCCYLSWRQLRRCCEYLWVNQSWGLSSLIRIKFYKSLEGYFNSTVQLNYFDIA